MSHEFSSCQAKEFHGSLLTAAVGLEDVVAVLSERTADFWIETAEERRADLEGADNILTVRESV